MGVYVCVQEPTRDCPICLDLPETPVMTSWYASVYVIHTHTYIHAYINTYVVYDIHAYVCICVDAYLCVLSETYIRTCTCMRMMYCVCVLNGVAYS